MILGMGERVDAIVTVTDPVPIVAAPEGKDGYALLNLRVDGRSPATDVAAFVAALRAGAPLNTSTLVAAGEVALPTRDPDATVELALAGPMAGYTWPINGRLYDPPNDGIELKTGQRVRVRFVNQSMMFHPMHLHGHTFQVERSPGPGPRKDTVLVPPKQAVTMDFDTNNPGRWIVHCHNDYHLDGGMATFFTYTE